MPPIECPTRMGLAAPICCRNSCRASARAATLHFPGGAVEATSKEIQLSAPRPRRAADSVQEHQRRQGGIAGGLVTEAAIPGFHGREMRHAGPPDKSDPSMLTGLPWLGRTIF